MNVHVSETVDLQQAIAKLDALPAMPAVARKLMMLDLDSDEGELQFRKLIEQDPLISAKLVGLANSPSYGSSRKIIAVSDAVLVLGMTRVRSIVFGITAMSSLTRFPEGKFKSQEVWMHSMSVAVAMSIIAHAMPVKIRPADDQVFFAGLLHDIGYMALSYLDSKASNLLHEQLQSVPFSMSVSIEESVLGMSHAEIGALLAMHWHLPEEVIAVIRDHHKLEMTGITEYQILVRLVQLAEKMLGEFCVNDHDGGTIAAEEWQALGINPDDADDIRNNVCEVATQAGQMAAAF